MVRFSGLLFFAEFSRVFLPVRRPALALKSQRIRVRWARGMLKAGHDFRRTLCSDEKVFVLEDRQRRCWMADTARRYRNCHQHPKHIMVWGGISLLGSTSIAFVDGNMDAVGYQKVLQNHLLPLVKRIRGPWAFQQDGARPHTARSTMAWIAAHGLPAPIEWPANSPDLSPVENLWALMVTDVNKHNPSTTEDLKRAIMNSWRERTRHNETMENLLGGWRRRLQQVVSAKGATIAY